MADVTVGGADRAAFVKGRDRCSRKPLAAGARCQVTVAFRPSHEGGQRAELTFHAQGSAEAPSIELAGSGIAPRVQIADLTGGEVVFSDVVTVGGAGQRQVELTNPGTAPLHVRGITAGGDFQVAAGGAVRASWRWPAAAP